MGTYSITGEHTIADMTGSPNVVANASAIGGASDLYLMPYSTTAEAVQPLHKDKTPTAGGSAGVSVQLASRRQYRILLEGAARCSARLVTATQEEDAFPERGAAGNDLLGYLEELWHLRHLRDREWVTLVAFMQSALSGAVFEHFSTEQARCIHILIADYLSNAGLTRERVVAAMQSLREVHIDVWAGLSQISTDIE